MKAIASGSVVCQLLVLSLATVTAQTVSVRSDSTVSKSPYASIRISADVDSAIVFLDSGRVGVTPFALDTLKPGRHSMSLIHPDLSNWLTGKIVDSITVSSSDTLRRVYSFDNRILLVSEPTGAKVFLGDSLIGITPIVSSRGGGDFRFRKIGFKDTTANSASLQRRVFIVHLEKEWKAEEDVDSPFKNDRGGDSRSIRLYIAGAATVMAGTAAAYFKTKADDRYAAYIDSGDPLIRNETRRLDTAATVALVATQLGIGLFTYFLLTE
jgi:hypothetical protein